MSNQSARLPLVVMISGNGSNLQAIIDAIAEQNLPVEIRAVISNRPDAYGLMRAQRARIPAYIVDHTQYSSRASFEAALEKLIDEYHPEVVVLAGFMRILNTDFVLRYSGRLINIHPSLLPRYRGLDTHQRVLNAGDQWHGATVHFVTHELDGGPAIVQARVPVLPDDTAQTLAARVLAQEHLILPLALRWIAEKRLCFKNHNLYFDGKPLLAPVQFAPA